MNKQIDILEDLLIDFDELGFVPTTTVPDPEGYAVRWKRRLVNALAGYRKQSEGEWVKSSYNNTLSCSICGNITTFRSKFCSGCVAKMKRRRGLMPRYIDADKLCENLTLMANTQEPYKRNTILGVVSTIQNTKTADVVPREKWISVEDRLPTEEENDRGLVGIVNGHNGKIGFHDAIIFVDYDFEVKEWWSKDYNLIGCTVEFWMPLPKMKGGEA